MASATALAMAPAVGMVGYLADRLRMEWPERLAVVGDVDGDELRYVPDRGHLVVGEVGRRDVPVLDDELLHQRIADALNNPAVDLPLMPQFVDDGANVLRSDEARQRNLAGLLIDFNLGHLYAHAGVGCTRSLHRYRGDCQRLVLTDQLRSQALDGDEASVLRIAILLG